MAASYLQVLGEREALAWVLRESRMAFPSTRRREVEWLQPEDTLYLVSTRGCFHNPGRDRTRVIGRARVHSPVSALPEPVVLAGREFTRGCDIRVEALAGYLDGVELQPLVARLDSFPEKKTWWVRLRRPLLGLSERDAVVLDDMIEQKAAPVEVHRGEYLERIRPVASQPGRRSRQ